MNRDVLVYWLATSEEEIHFIDAVISAYDGMASVRREYMLRDGQAMYKVYVSGGMETEFLDVIERLRRHAKIGDVVRGEGDEIPPSH